MWTPKQLLTPEVVKSLLQSEHFTKYEIEFLGWSNGRAMKLNESGNPVKAAMTMLRDAHELHNGKDNTKTHLWLDKFYERKMNSVRPKPVYSSEDAIKKARSFAKFTEDWCQEPEEPEAETEEKDEDNENE